MSTAIIRTSGPAASFIVRKWQPLERNTLKGFASLELRQAPRFPNQTVIGFERNPQSDGERTNDPI